MVTKNQILSLAVVEQNDLGFGIARHEGMIVFVSGALAGEQVEARIIKVHKTYAVARTERILTVSALRTEPVCSHKGCGGCVWGSVTYEGELAAKRQGVEEAMRRHGMDGVEVADVQCAASRTGYRNKAQYPVSLSSDGEVRIGFFAPKSHRVVEAADCPLQDPTFPEILETVRGFLQKYRISIYNEDTKSGLVRHICLRRGAVSGELLVVLVLCGSTIPHAEDLVASLRERHEGLVGVLLNENREDTNVLFGKTFHTLWGRPYLYDTLCGVRLRLAPQAFYQVNHAAAELLYRTAADLADLKGDELLLDLFCGVGSIGLSMAHRVGEVVGVEIVPEAVECARENAHRAGISNASFYCADADRSDGLLSEAEAARGEPLRPDVVILDPPRRGCSADLLTFLSDLSPSKIVYISCNPDTLARDLARLLPCGYSLSSPVIPVNMFPLTAHVESLVCLTRQTN